jgi:hypothetical protein
LSILLPHTYTPAAEFSRIAFIRQTTSWETQLGP